MNFSFEPKRRVQPAYSPSKTYIPLPDPESLPPRWVEVKEGFEYHDGFGRILGWVCRAMDGDGFDIPGMWMGSVNLKIFDKRNPDVDALKRHIEEHARGIKHLSTNKNRVASTAKGRKIHVPK